MAYLKRQRAPKSWRTSRKGTAFVAKPISKQGVPLVVIMRDILGIVQTKKEIKKAAIDQKVLVNNKPVRDENKGVGLFDTISIVPSDTHYRVNLSEKGKYRLEEISQKESKKKTEKIVGKKMLKKGAIQVNLRDGRNFISEKETKTNDSVVVDFENKKIEKHVPLKENSKIVVFSGKHTGKEGKVERLDQESKEILIDDGQEKLNVPIENAIAIE